MSIFGKYFLLFKSKRTELLLLLFSSFIAIFLAILFVEFYSWSIHKKQWVGNTTQFDSEIGWINTPNQTVVSGKKTYSTNSLGFRSEEINPDKNHVLIVGDSVAFGLGVNDNETVSYYISEELKEFQTLNLAVSGYGIDQYYLMLKRHVAKTNPKLIIVIISTVNDLRDTLSNNLFGISKPFFTIKNNALINTENPISKFSCTNLFTKSWLLSNYFSYFKERVCTTKRLDHDFGKEVIAKILKKIKALAIQNNSELLFVISPTEFDLLMEACSSRSSRKFCLKNRDIFLKSIFKKKEEDPENYAQWFTKRFTGFVYNLTFFQSIFENSEFFYIDFFREITKKEISANELYLDHIHLSAFGNQYLSKTIVNRYRSKNG